MNQNDFREELKKLKAYRETRLKLADIVLQDPKKFPELLDICYEFDDEISSRACWILEFVCYKKLDWLFPYLDHFSSQLRKFTLDSSVRPVSKVVQLCCQYYFKQKKSKQETPITITHLERFTEAGFDWLIENQKVAVKAYSMRFLYLLGKELKWVWPELKLVLEQGYSHHSAAYKAAARDILSKIKI